MDQLNTADPSKGTTGGASAPPVLLSARNLTKIFAGVAVVDAANVVFRAGEVHGIVGQNGAGKSSLMKMVAGVYKADSGVVDVGGKEHVFSTPRQARENGVSLVAQELSLVPELPT